MGLIGLGGAIVGATAAFAGVVYQQKHQAQREDAQRLVLLSEGAIDSLISQLELLREHAWRHPGDEEGADYDVWVARLIDLLHPMRLTMMRLSDASLRQTLEAAWLFEFGHSAVLQEEIGLRSTKLVITRMAGEAQDCLGHHLRREPIPRTTFLSVAVRTHARVLRRQP